MNLFQLVLKQMRQRALGTWLTMLSVMLGVGLAVAVLLVRRGGDSLFGQRDYGYDLIIGKGSPLQLVFNTVYHMDASPGNVPYALYENLANPRHPQSKLAIPMAVGDSYKQRRIIATNPAMFGYADDGTRIAEGSPVFNYRIGKRFELASGKMFHPAKFEAIVGSDVPGLAGLKVGDTFQPTHGAAEPGQPTGHIHADTVRVVGVLAPTHTANDGAIFVPLAVHYSLEEHSDGLKAQARMREQVPGQPVAPPSESAAPETKPVESKAPAPTNNGGDLLADDTPAKKDDHDHDHDKKTDAAHKDDDDHDHDHGAEEKHHEHEGGEGHAHEHKGYSVNADGTIVPKLTKDQWVLSAILVKVREFKMDDGQVVKNPLVLKSFIDSSGIAVAVMPADVMSKFLRGTMDDLMLLLLVISALVSIVAAAGILVSIYNSVSARMREIAILRALGATKGRVVTLICLEAGTIGLIGGVVGWALGHAIAMAGSAYMQYRLGQGFDTFAIGWEEPAYLVAVVIVAVLAGLVPAMKAYRTPVATNLVAS